MKKTLLRYCVLSIGSAFPLAAGVVVDVDFEFLSAKIDDPDGIDDGDRVEDVSGNGYHGFWGQTGSNVPIVVAPGGTGIDNTSSTGKVFLRDGLAGIPDEWDGPTTSVTPYFTLDGGSAGSGGFTLEAIVNWNGTGSTRNGIMGQASTGNQIWVRESGGFLQYAIGDEGTKDANLFSNTIDVTTEKADGLWHHLALVYDGVAGEIRTYVDHQLVHTNTDADIGDLGVLLNDTSDFYLGAYNATTADQFNGIQDHYRISDTALDTVDFLPVPVAPPAREITWTGAVDGIWDVMTTSNWELDSDSSATAYEDGDSLTFDDSGANPSITIDAGGGTVAPDSMTFDHSAIAYSLAGDGTSGAAALIKQGTGTLTLTNPNDYLLGTDIQGGAVVAGDGAISGEIGAGPVTVAAGAVLRIERSDTLDYSNGNTTAGGSKLVSLSGAGDVVIDGGVNLILNPGSGNDLEFDLANSWAGFSGTITVKGGSILDTRRVGRSALGSGTVVLGDGSSSGSLAQHVGSWTWATDIDLVGSDNQILNNSTGFTNRFLKLQGVISGSGGLTFSDTAGTMQDPDRGFILTGSNTLDGTVTIDAGTPVRVGGVPGDDFTVNADSFGSLGTATVVNDGTLTFSRTDAHTLDSAISGLGGVRIGMPSAAGNGDTSTQVVTIADATKTYEGTTTVESGTLLVNGTLPNSVVDVNPEGTLGGTGTVSLSTLSYGNIAPGASVGTLSFDDLLIMVGDSSYTWEVSDFTGSAGTGYDTLAADSIEFVEPISLVDPITAANPVTIVVSPDSVVNFSETTTTFTLATAVNPITVIDVNAFVVDDTAFAAATGSAGTWAVQLSGDSLALELVYTFGVPADDFANWIDGFFPGETDPAIVGFDADPDGDGIDNGVENFLGTAPDAFSAGLTVTGSTATSVTATHTQTNDAASDVTGGYEWSSDLASWNASGATDGNGVTATISAVVTDDQAAPALDTVEVTAEVTGGSAERLFLRATATQAP